MQLLSFAFLKCRGRLQPPSAIERAVQERGTERCSALLDAAEPSATDEEAGNGNGQRGDDTEQNRCGIEAISDGIHDVLAVVRVDVT